jgi:hypothetical protein
MSLDPELDALTAALGGLSPATPALNRDRLIYEAGRRAASPRRVWPIATGVLAILSVGLGARLATTSVPAPLVEYVYVSPPPAPESHPPVYAYGSPETVTPRSSGAGYLRLRDQVVRFGADSLPDAGPTYFAPPQDVEKMLGLPAGTLDESEKSRWQHQLTQGDI